MQNVSFPGLGLQFQISRIAFSIGDFNVYWYGILIGIGFLLALVFAIANLKRFGINDDGFSECVIAGLVGGIIGARLFYVFFKWDYYSQNPSEIIQIHNGGLAIYGGIIGAVLFGCIVAKIRKINIPALLDIVSMGFLIGQGIGRWGNFVNQEAFGIATDLPWRMVSENTGGIGVHPCFLYESVWCILGFFVLYIISLKGRKFDGQIALTYLVWYGAERMVVEGLRTDSLYTPLYGLRISQVISAVLVFIGIILLIVCFAKSSKNKNSKKHKETEEPEFVDIMNNINDKNNTDE